VGQRLWWVGTRALYFYVKTNQVGQRTLYASQMAPEPGGVDHVLYQYYMSQTTGQILDRVSTIPLGPFNYEITAPAVAWDTDLGFNYFSGILEFGSWAWLPCQNNSWFQVGIGISAVTMSEELKTQLIAYPDDRLFIIWNQPHGHMMAASHGKYWSESNIDQTQINTFVNPPDSSNYALWTCNQSTDVLISEACTQLYDTYQSWTAIPDLKVQLNLNNTPYYVAVGHSYTAINITVIMLMGRQSVMGDVSASQTTVKVAIANKKSLTYIVLGVLSFFSVLLPLTLGVWLGSRLLGLAAEMEEIVKLEFEGVVAPPTVFSELHRFQTSFTKMERGLRAFSKFVPQAVVKVLIAGKMEANQSMVSQPLTIMFADIEGFSAICESLHPDELAEVCTEYFELMCNIVRDEQGTIDKFIGDCIMCIWNAPVAVAGHERHAVQSALLMQQGILALHGAWQRRGLPLLKFRASVHTGSCLVGNFGCSYRVSYTCLGDAVNAAARLEALNKKFGTYLCVSQTTHQRCKDRFNFRRLARVTVPGKVEILDVYEVLCPSDIGADADASQGYQMTPVEATLNLVPEEKQRPPLYVVQPAPRITPAAGDVVYHWGIVKRSHLLEHSAHYESAYRALVDGDHATARHFLQTGRVLQIPDRAWTALEEQLDRMGPNGRWDGVINFKEK